MKGAVKRFNKDKGYGFITCEDKVDAFFHYSQLLMDGYKTVNIGQEVEFETEENEKGRRALQIHLI